MIADEDFISQDTLLPAENVKVVTRKIDVWNVRAKPFVRRSSPLQVFWCAEVAGISFGPYANIGSLWRDIEEKLRGTVKTGYRFGA